MNWNISVIKGKFVSSGERKQKTSNLENPTQRLLKSLNKEREENVKGGERERKN